MTRWHKGNQVRIQFLTGNVYRRVPLFKESAFCRVLLDSLGFCRDNHNVEVHGFVIMPDHFHLLVGVPKEGTLQDFLRDWKGFSAHTIIEDIRRSGRKDRLEAFSVRNRKRTRDSRFRVFQPDTHVEGITSEKFARQKLDYIHKNPVRAGLVESPGEYPYSSARNWMLNDQSIFRVDPLKL